MRTKENISSWQNKVKKMQKIEKTSKYIINIIIISIMMVSLTLIVKTFTVKDEIASVFGVKTFIVVSGSMQPYIGTGDVVFVKKAETVNVNDVISYKQSDMIVTHRVIKIIEENGTRKYQTKGDNNTSVDASLVSPDEVEGTMIFKMGRIGQVLIFLKTKIGIAFLGAIIVVIYVQSQMTDKKKEARGRKRRMYELKSKKQKLKK